MAAFKFPLKIDQGSTFDEVVTWKAGNPAVPVDLTGCTAVAQIRATIDSVEVLLEMSTTNGMIQLGDTAGTIRFLIPYATTAAFNWTTAVYDLEITFPGGQRLRKLRGPVTVSKEVTRD